MNVAPILEETEQNLTAGTNVLQIVNKLRKVASAEQTALILELAQLRIRGIKKFRLASRMFFTKRTLEMATDELIASWKAKRFVGMDSVVDICCGIGGDLIGLAQGLDQQVVGIDREELMVCYAEANLAAHQLDASIELTSFEDFDWSTFDAVHIDPERRTRGRSVRGSHFSPPLNDIFSAAGDNQSLAIKVAPATDCSQLVPPDAELQWIGHSRECKQQVVWLGKLATHPGCRSVGLLGQQGVSEFVANRNVVVEQAIAESVGAYVYEPHNIVLAADLTDAIASQYGLARVGVNNVYLTGDKLVENPMLAAFQVCETLPASLTKVAGILKKMDVGRLTVKKRGVLEHIVEKYKRLKLTGSERATLLLTRIGDQRIAIVAKRVRGD